MVISRYAFNYRFLAFLALSCSIAMVARVSGDGLLLVVGVAGLAAGNIYMWRNRYAVSWVRTAVLLLLLTVLLFYLGRDMLFSWNNDPLLLARYLVYGLIVTGFDLRTRRNVMGTLVLAGMLLVLLSQMAFDLWFPVMVGIFVLLALAASTVAISRRRPGRRWWWAEASGRRRGGSGRALSWASCCSPPGSSCSCPDLGLGS